MNKSKIILILIILFTAILRLYNLSYPNKYVFDEVYHAYTAKQYLAGNKDAWSPWGKATEQGTAFEWLHPPIAKEIMTASMFVFQTTDAWAWRLPGAILGIVSVFLVYKLGKILFKNAQVGLISAFIFSIEGLVFVQSRTGMNDAYLVTFVLTSVIFFVQKKYFLSSLFMGISMATKWPGIYLILMYFPILIYHKKFSKLIYFIIIPPVIYLFSYTPYFLIGYTWSDFIELNWQTWWYQTHLKATHSYSSPWWSWPINLYPVWYFVEYQKNTMSNIFASGNPLVFWLGFVSIIITLMQYIKTKSEKLLIILLGFTIFWLPWALSPRIMFLYHFSPSVPFLSLALGNFLNKQLEFPERKKIILLIFLLITINFLLIFPFLTGMPIPKNFVNLFFLFNLSKNPFFLN